MAIEYDLVVLGGGIGGYVGAIRAAQLGMSVAIVEKEKLGGTCLHKGCIPSKALLQSASTYRLIKNADEYGVITNANTFDFTKIQSRKNTIVDQLYQGIQLLMKKNKIDVYNGRGTILGASIFSPIPGTISIEHEDGTENTMLIPKQVLLATGSVPNELEHIPIDGKVILHSDHILELNELPANIVIVGGGVIGIEWASLLTDLDVKVTVIEYENHILPSEDADVRKYLQKSLEKRGVQFYTNTLIDHVDVHNNAVQLTITQGEHTQTLHSEKVLLSVGRKANTNQIGLSNTSIEIENGFIQTNEYYQTEESHIYAIGDCIGGVQLAHVASAEAIVAVEHMNDKLPNPIQKRMIPSCIYSYPEASKIGLSEQEAKEQGIAIQVGKFPYQAIGKAQVNGDTEGFCKVIVNEETDDIVGIHIVGESATELIGEASLATFLDASGWELSQTMHAHPSLTELFQEASLAVRNKQIHG